MDNTPRKPRNRRRSIRRVTRRTTKITCYRGPMGLGANLAEAVLDLSETGLRLLASVPLTRGEELEVNLLGIGQSRPLRLKSDVVWCVPAADGRFCVGVAFRRPLSYRYLQEM